MFVPFSDIAEDARVWIYQSDRQLSTEESQEIQATMSSFLEQWSAHGNNLLCTSEIFYDRFLVIALDENIAEASGCSIDASVHFIQSLERKFNINFFDRTKVAFLDDDSVFIEDLGNLKTKISDGSITKDHITFNNLVKNVGEFSRNWKVTAEDSWLSRYFR